jgi:hypothetical protein
MEMFLALSICVCATVIFSLAAIEGFWPVGRGFGEMANDLGGAGDKKDSDS